MRMMGPESISAMLLVYHIALTVSLMQFFNLLGESAAEEKLVIDLVPGATVNRLLCGGSIGWLMANHRDMAANLGPGKRARG